MIISRTPIRISLLGGGTDYPEAVQKWGGITLGTTINKYSYITCRNLPPFFNYKTRLMYSKLETVDRNSKIEHKVINKVISHLGLTDSGLEISHMSDLPTSSGTGSSSAFIVGLIHALEKLKRNNKYCTPFELYNTAVHIEQILLKDNVGYQDSAWAAFGGFNLIRWKGKLPQIEKIYLYQDFQNYLERSLLLVHTGIFRNASKIVSTYNIQDKEKEHKKLMELTEQGMDAIREYNYPLLGNIIHQSWEIKKEYSANITNDVIDNMFKTGMSLGAYGGKLLGAGGGGCLLFVIRPCDREEISYNLQRLGGIPIDFRFESEGSKIILEDR